MLGIWAHNIGKSGGPYSSHASPISLPASALALGSACAAASSSDGGANKARKSDSKQNRIIPKSELRDFSCFDQGKIEKFQSLN